MTGYKKLNLNQMRLCLPELKSQTTNLSRYTLFGQRQATASSDVPLFAGIGGSKYLCTFREALAG